jgi:RsiW-degrading membrane proteinase PrsW (M82 family)
VKEKPPGKSSRTSNVQSPDPSSAAVPDDWLFGDQMPAGGAQESVDSDEYGVAADNPAPPPRIVRKPKDSTFVPTFDSSDPADGRQHPRRALAADNLPDGSPAAWRNQLYWVLLLAIAPLAISIVWPGRPTAERFKETLQQLPENAAQDPANAVAPQADVSVDDFFNRLPEHRIVGAHLARDSSLHWGYAALSATLFLALLTLMFPNDAAGPSRLIWTGIITGTIGILLLLGFQWVAHFTQGFNIRGRGIVVLLFYIVKFIGYSYRAALDPQNGFLLSFMGFTCGVGLCEELCKAFPIILFLRAKPHCGWRAACAVGLASGVGFGVSEGVTYAADSYNGIAEGMLYLVRFASCVALHAIWAGSVALVINRNQDYVGGDGFDWGDAGNFILHYLAIAMILHGLYDTLLKKDYEIAALAVAVASFAWLAWLVTRERREE